jgi:hypothetical protein
MRPPRAPRPPKKYVLHANCARAHADRCAVCLNALDRGHCRLRCQHCFHVRCLQGWLDLDHDSCPVCRRVLAVSRVHIVV